MVMKNGEVVFFEGNFAAARIPRRMFLAPQNLHEFIRMFAWPFGSLAGGYVFAPADTKDD